MRRVHDRKVLPPAAAPEWRPTPSPTPGSPLLLSPSLSDDSGRCALSPQRLAAERFSPGSSSDSDSDSDSGDDELAQALEEQLLWAQEQQQQQATEEATTSARGGGGGGEDSTSCDYGSQEVRAEEEARVAARAAAPAGAPAAARPPPEGLLLLPPLLRPGGPPPLLLPHELVVHVLRFLSAEDLSAAAAACRALRAAAREPALWRALYLLRWEAGLSERERAGLPGAVGTGGGWRAGYFARDAADVRHAAAGAARGPPEFRAIYVSAATARRAEAPKRRRVSDDRAEGAAFAADAGVPAALAAWRRAMRAGGPGASAAATTSAGAGAAAASAAATMHEPRCSGRTCTYFCAGNIYICNATGAVHVCDEGSCMRLLSGTAGEQPVCPVSGRCYAFAPSGRDGRAGEEDDDEGRGADNPGDGGGEMLGMRAAYEAGYYAENERDLRAAQRRLGL